MAKTKLSGQPSTIGSDDMQTPPWCLGALYPYLENNVRPYKIWEPACGNGNLVRGLQDNGFKVVGSDIKYGFDFFCAVPAEVDMIITNPPYTIKDQWIARCYEIGKPFALLLPLTALEGKVRQGLYRQHGLELILLPRRVKFETPSGKGSGSWFPTAWFTWGLGVGSDLTFWEGEL